MASSIVVSAKRAQLNRKERTHLSRLEDVIATAIRWRLEAAKALVAIRDQRLYRAEFSSFEAYARERWGYERAYVYQLCQWGEVVQNVSGIAESVPERESHARPLYGLSAEEQRKAWIKYCKTRRTERHSAREIEATVRQIRQKQEKRLGRSVAPVEVVEGVRPVFQTTLGTLYNCDCLTLLKKLPSETADLFFADPPFNVGKDYGVAFNGQRINDRLPDEQYLGWCQKWLDKAIRVLKPGGSLFIYHLPRWNMRLGSYLMAKPELDFRHWITVNINGQMPIKGRLMPQGYSLLYFSKGQPKTFRKIWTPIRRCRKCNTTVNDYGGYLKEREENQPGIRLSDVWNDITAVRHRKFKTEARGERNQLSTKILERVIGMSTEKGDLVVDVFGGAGTTFRVSEATGRQWIGAELGSCSAIIERMTRPSVDGHSNDDIIEA